MDSRSPAYHNWCHGFTVAHFAYLVLKNSRLMEAGVVSSLEAFALLIAAMCHDLDHRGTNNSYQELYPLVTRMKLDKHQIFLNSFQIFFELSQNIFVKICK